MGSPAAAYTFSRLVELTPARTDQEYLEVFIHNNSRVPDRTRGILGLGESPLAELQRSVATLNGLGVDCIIIACMSSHYLVDELRKSSRAEIIDGVEETVAECSKLLPQVTRVGILATTGSIKLGLFQKKLAAVGMEPILFDDEEQQHFFMDPVYEPWGIKAGNVGGKAKRRLEEAARRLVELGAQAVIMGCTEVPLVLGSGKVDVPLVDSIDCLCRSAIARCLPRAVP